MAEAIALKDAGMARADLITLLAVLLGGWNKNGSDYEDGNGGNIAELFNVVFAAFDVTGEEIEAAYATYMMRYTDEEEGG